MWDCGLQFAKREISRDKNICFKLEGLVFGGEFWHVFQGGPIEVDKMEGGRRKGECGMNNFAFLRCGFWGVWCELPCICRVKCCWYVFALVDISLA